MLVLIGRTASGKTLVRDILTRKHKFNSIVTYTSRPMRKGEIQDKTYHFISADEFKQKIESGFFAEWKQYHTNDGVWYYGTALEDCTNSDDKSVIILTPDGVRDLINNGVKCVVIYIYSNLQTIRHRLQLRGDNADESGRRIKTDTIDFKNADLLADRIVYNNLNDNIDNVVGNVTYYYDKILKEKSNG